VDVKDRLAGRYRRAVHALPEEMARIEVDAESVPRLPQTQTLSTL